MGGGALALTAAMPLPLAHRAYRLLLRAISLPVLGWLWWRGRQDSGYRQRLRERLGFIDPAPASLNGLLIHAASVGEVQAVRPLIEALRQHWPDHTISVSTQSPTGARQLQQHWGDAIQHLFLPLDTPGATARFLNRLQPQLVLLVERELWPEFMAQCRFRGTPVALVNARLSEASARSYRRWGAVMRPVWSQLARVLAADAPSALRLRELGVPVERLSETGNLKFDQPLPAAAGPVAPWLHGRTVLVAGSTHEGEESALLAAWPALLRQHPDGLLLLVPRHPERFDAVAQQIEAAGFALRRRSRQQAPGPQDSVFLADTMGELGLWYGQARVCFIGGTLVPIGGHNALEALACGKPVLFGPHTQHFESLYEAIETGALGARCASAEAVLATALRWLANPTELERMGEQARGFVHSQQGSSERSLQALQPLWGRCSPAALAPLVSQRIGADTLWHDPERLPVCLPSHFEAPADASALATGSGRGQAHRLRLNGSEVVLRHYRRGGWMARLSADRYPAARAADSRAMREYALLRQLRAWGLPVPAPVAARQAVQGLCYRADIVVALIPGSQNVVQRLDEAPLEESAWQALGRAIRQLHDRQVFHADLNAHNLLLDDQGTAWVVDFDKCAVRPGQDWKRRNLERLLRSLRKETGRRPGFHWRESQWAPLMAGYEG